ncbi:MAG TPA: hypothetical protein VHC72_19195, partial [Bryobacteraceae bacterium]|nr:hypothetical protein [Bryobacteraceae bacterium]
MPTAFLADPIAKEHVVPMGHPERPRRWDAAVRGLGDAPLTEVAPREAAPEDLLRCHRETYLQTARRDVQAGLPTLSTGDTDVGPRSWEVALRAVGTCLNGVDLVMEGRAENAFC